MNVDALVAFSSKHPWVVPSIILGVFAAIWIAVWVKAAELKRNLRACSTTIATWNPIASETSEPDICRFIRQHLISKGTVEVPGWSGARLLLSKEIDEIFDDYVDRRTSSVRFALGPLATGFALICTFGLIAHVLQTDVSNAVRGTATGAGSNDQLASAVGTLGVKFYISAAGILASLVFAVTLPALRKRLYQASHDAARAVAPHFCTSATLAAVTHLEVLRELRGARQASSVRDGQRMQDAAVLRSQLAQMSQTLLATQTELTKLQSIEVSVQDLSAEVTTQLRQMLTQDLGEQLREMLGEVMKDASTLTTQLQEKILEGLERTFQREVPRIIESLQAIQKSVEGQAESPMERLLEQLQGVVAGGFKGESAQMAATMRQFSEVVPALAEQLRATAANLTSDMQTRSSESARANESLLTQVTALLSRLESQQLATEKLVSEIGHAASSSAESLVQKVHSESNALFQGLLETSRRDVDQLLSRMSEATNTNTNSYANLAASVESTSNAILQARDGLLSAADSIQKLTLETRTTISQARQSNEIAERAATTFTQSATQLREGSDAMANAVTVARQHAVEQAQLLDSHRRALTELETLWPTLFDAYLKNFDAKSNQLLANWEDFHRRTGQFSQTVGSTLADAAEELSSSVDRLSKLYEAKRA